MSIKFFTARVDQPGISRYFTIHAESIADAWAKLEMHMKDDQSMQSDPTPFEIVSVASAQHVVQEIY